MTIFAGAFSFDPNTPLPAALRSALRQHVTRSADAVAEVDQPGIYLAKVDIGAFGAGGLHTDDAGNTTLIAGEPLLIEGDGVMDWNREKDMALLHPFLARGSHEVLRRARGTFCGVHYNAGRRECRIFVDKVGVRPVYMWVGPNFAVFASALRVLEAVAMVPKEFDVRGVTEIAVFGYPMADRTPYLGISMLMPGELVRLSTHGAARERYFRWDGPLVTPASNEEALQRCYDAFMAAIKRRQRTEKIGAAFLSGGLDSRAIVGGLHAIGSEVYTVNYAPDGSQDQVFAALVAKKLDIHYTQIETNAGNVAQGYRKAEVAKWIASTFSAIDTDNRPPVLWSGDGGSVALGHVYVKRKLVSLMAAGETDHAVRMFNPGVPTRVLRRGVRESVAEIPIEGVMAELDAIDCDDPGRKFHLFLMSNDQRRHLVKHFEDIDVERLEFHLPFFDADYLETIMRLPSERFLEHHFYMDWLAQFPGKLNMVPWQAYPGHVPCNLESPPGLKYQWDTYYDKSMYREMKVSQAQRGREILSDDAFPSHLLSRTTLNLAVLMTYSGVRDYSYLIKTASTYYRYWKNCSSYRATATA